jgi:hypothetical protein
MEKYTAIRRRVESSKKLWFFCFKGVFSVGITGCADIADTAITAASRAEFTAIKYNLQVKTVPVVTMEQLLQVMLCLSDVFSFGQSPALGKTMDMGIHWKGRVSKALGHHNARSFVAYTRKGL